MKILISFLCIVLSVTSLYSQTDFKQSIDSTKVKNEEGSRLYLCGNYYGHNFLREGGCDVWGSIAYKPGVATQFEYILKGDIPGGRYKCLLCISPNIENADSANFEIGLLHVSQETKSRNIIAQRIVTIDTTQWFYLITLDSKDPDSKAGDTLVLYVQHISKAGSTTLTYGAFPTAKESDIYSLLSHLEVPWKIE